MKLQVIVQKYPDVISNPQRLAAVLNDLFPTEKQFVHISVIMCETGMLNELQTLEWKDPVYTSRYVARIVSIYGIQEQLVNKGIDLWADAFCLPKTPPYLSYTGDCGVQEVDGVSQCEVSLMNENLSCAEKTSIPIGKKVLKQAALSVIILIIVLIAALVVRPGDYDKEKGSDIEDLVQQTNENLNPYFAVMGLDVSNGNPIADQIFIDNMSSIEIMGYVGSLSHGWNEYAGKKIIEILQWESNEAVSDSEFQVFLEAMNEYFGEEATIETYDYIADETWGWIDAEKNCSVLAWLEDGKMHLSWDLNYVPLESEQQEAVKEYPDLKGEEDESTISDLLTQTKDNLIPYFSVIGADVTSGNPDVSQEFIDNITSVDVMGYTGSITHGWSEYSGKRIIDLLEWESNDTVLIEEFNSFLEKMNAYFKSEGVLSNDRLEVSSWEWVDSEQNCPVLAWYDNGIIHLSWEFG